MSIKVEEILSEMLGAAAGAFADQWDHVKKYLPGEFRKFAVQVVEVAENVAKFEIDPAQGYPPAAGKVLLQMQRTAMEAVLTAMTAVTIIAVQNAINAILKAVGRAFAGILQFLPIV